MYCAIPFDGTQVDDLRCRELYGFMPTTYDICYNKCEGFNIIGVIIIICTSQCCNYVFGGIIIIG